MKIGLIGLPLTGKTTFFNLLTSGKVATGNFSGKAEANVGVARVPDVRIDFLSNLYKPKKTTYAQIEFTDIAGLMVSEGDHKAASKFLNDVRNCDALVHVLRAFANPDVVHVVGEINPARDLEAVEMELLFSDMELIEKRMERIKTGKKITKENQVELNILEKCYSVLESGMSMRDVELSEEERISLRNYAFLTEKPRLAVVNLDEEQFKKKEYPHRQELQALCREKNIPLLEICALMELEISELEEEDKKLFMEDLGLEATGIELLARNVYEHLGLISFFTVGEDEVRAWTIDKGTNAKEAAGKIHSDIERGFIRAEIVKYKDIAELGAMSKVKEKGLFRLEGKEYIVEDGDIINFRFNV
ncbi:MAG: redox-regulated ATPase YchF [Bacillota bacterium]|uniref:Ribosome-binding ATPase YchF n=1 Tax=Thermanaerosceptrum fracticalcis TaxID=1712410 RepID=A0A7G6E1X6_THEFR|nr:redox-regulated ATPase YchF [Thermanaerosceptrum fracticalcis]QNB46080.1 redox-regulated ATPase YchF [Thermanaerosceptrum fracticalcis]